MSAPLGGFKDSISTMDGNGNGMRITKIPAAADRKSQNRALTTIMMTPMVELVSKP